MSVDHYTYRVSWSPEDGEYVAVCVELPSFSWLARTHEKALSGIRKVIAEAVADMQSNGEPIPEPFSDGATVESFAFASHLSFIAHWLWKLRSRALA